MRQRRRSTLLVGIPIAVLGLPVLLLMRRGGIPDADPMAWAQTSSCGNAILEPGEQCDPPGSLTCPPGSPSGAHVACNADCTCPSPPAALDHFQCYALRPRRFAALSATITDQYGTLVQTVRAPNRLCVPADKNGEGISDPTAHLVGYVLKPSRNPRFQRRTDQTVVNQFGTQRLDVLRPSWLLVPSSKDGVPLARPLDHFQCYVIRNAHGAPRFTPRTVTVSSQIETVTLQVERPFRFCVPADKNGEDPSAPSHPDQLLCYRTRSGRFGDADHSISNQFGEREVQLITRNELCVPSSASPSTTTTTATTPTTSSTTSTSIATTTTSSTIGPVTTSTSTTTTTTTTLYGSPSRAFVLPSSSLLD